MVSLFNVTVLSAPTLVQRYVFDKYSFSGAEWDPYGFRFLGESKLLLLPLTINDNPPFDGFTIMNMTIDVIKPLFNVSMAEPDRISNWCWSCTTMPPRSLVFRGHATFVKGHSFKSVELSASVAKGSEEVRWTNVLDPPNLKKDACCDYWPLVEEGGIVLDAKSPP
jgi:Beta propeller domain